VCVAAHPQQPIQINTGGRCTGHIEAIARIDERRDLAAACHCTKQLKKKRGPAG
jgi:hypothetical protein